MIAVSCQCGKTFKAKPEYAGRRVKCPQCKDPLQIPMAKKPSSRKTDALNPMDSLLDEVGVNKAGSAGSCPKCKEQLTKDAVLCVNCGYHLEGGKQLGTKSLIRKTKGVNRAHLGSEFRSDLPKSVVKLATVSKTAGLVMTILSAVSLMLIVVMTTMPEIATQIQQAASFLSVGVLAGATGLSLISGILAFIVSKKARRGLPEARSLGFPAALMMLLVLPIGTLFGLMMLMPLMHADTKRFYR